MSVRERMMALRAQKALELQRVKEKEEANEKARRARIKLELPESIKEVNSKLVRFKKLGLLGVVEELVESKIEPLQNPYEAIKPRKYRPPTTKDLADLINSNFQIPNGRFNRNYVAEILNPSLVNKVWDTDLKIKIALPGDYFARIREGRGYGKSYPWVDVVFDNITLTVLSSDPPQRVLLGRPFNRAQRIDAFEDALARAILNPQSPKVPKYDRFYNDAIFDVIFRTQA